MRKTFSVPQGETESNNSSALLLAKLVLVFAFWVLGFHRFNWFNWFDWFDWFQSVRSIDKSCGCWGLANNFRIATRLIWGCLNILAVVLVAVLILTLCPSWSSPMIDSYEVMNGL